MKEPDTPTVIDDAQMARSLPPENTESGGSGEEGSIGTVIAIGLALIAMMLAAYGLYRSGTAAPHVYVVDTDKLASSYLAGVMQQMKPTDDPQVIQQQMYEKMQQIRAHLNNLGADGSIIVHRSAVLTYPPDADITPQIAADLGINLLPDVSTSPANLAPAPAPATPDAGAAAVGSGQETAKSPHGASLD